LPKQLSSVFLTISRNQEQALAYGQNARDLAERNFNQTEMMVRFEKVLHV
jgi:hypothetical protein